MTTFLQYTLSGLMTGTIYGLVAMGFVLIYKSSKVLNFAQGTMLMLLSYVSWSFFTQLHLPFWLAFLATLAVAVILALLVERIILRPLIGQPLLAIIMVTIALAALFEGIEFLIWQSEYRVYEPAFLPTEIIHVGPLIISQAEILCFGIAVVLVFALSLFFKYTRQGLAMRAVAEDHQAAQSRGIRVHNVFAWAWAISAIVSAIGGMLLGSIMGISFAMSWIGLKVFPVVLLGGLESLPGAIIAGLIVGVLENIAGGYLDPLVGGGIKEIFPFIILIIVLLIKPYGLFGLERIERI
ncbi:MAG: branched-chain amino acid ABC transporter permease [Pseudomonadota bacterium]